jgi:hypothetical protein
MDRVQESAALDIQKIFRWLGGAGVIAVLASSVAFAGCGGGGGGGGVAGCLGYGGGGGGGYGGGGGSCGGGGPTPTPAPSAQPVGVLLSGETPQSVPTYGSVLGYFNGTTPNGKGTDSNVVNLTANQNVQFVNLETTASGIPHTASFLGPWSGSFPTNGPGSGATTASPAGTAISAPGFSTGSLNPGQASAVYNSGGPGVYVFGCFYHYKSNGMRTVIIVM